MKKLKLLLVLGLLLAAGNSYAGNTLTVSFLGYSGSGWQSGYPYFANVNGVTIDVMCDDYVHGGAAGESWQANETNLGSGDLSLLRFNLLPNADTLYKEAGWLLLETQVTQQNQWVYMNEAVWYIFDSQAPLGQGAQFWLNAALQEAQNGFQGVDFSKVEILTPTDQYAPDPNLPQELMFLTDSHGGNVPEPGTLILLGTGLLGAWGRRKLMS